jgi:hypothetical protein
MPSDSPGRRFYTLDRDTPFLTKVGVIASRWWLYLLNRDDEIAKAQEMAEADMADQNLEAAFSVMRTDQSLDESPVLFDQVPREAIDENSLVAAMVNQESHEPQVSLEEVAAVVGNALNSLYPLMIMDQPPRIPHQKLAAYTSDPESSAYTTTGIGLDIASKADLNALRVAYETLRVMCEDLRTKFQKG